MSDLDLHAAALRVFIIERDDAIRDLAIDRDRAIIAYRILKGLDPILLTDDAALDAFHAELVAPDPPSSRDKVPFVLHVPNAAADNIRLVPPPAVTDAQVGEVCRQAVTDKVPFAKALKKQFGWAGPYAQKRIADARAAGVDIPHLRGKDSHPAGMTIPTTTAETKAIADQVKADRPTPSPPVMPAVMVLMCEECDQFDVAVGPNAAHELSNHTSKAHRRAPTRQERTPRRATAS